MSELKMTLCFFVKESNNNLFGPLISEETRRRPYYNQSHIAEQLIRKLFKQRQLLGRWFPQIAGPKTEQTQWP
jgi:hypothetical protein